jgi:hypothetical protein
MQLRRQVESHTKSITHKPRHTHDAYTANFHKAASKVTTLIEQLSDTPLAILMDELVAAHPPSPVLSRHMPQSPHPKVAKLSKDLFVQLDRYHRAASRELARVEIELVDLYPTTRECRGYRPPDLSLMQYTAAYAQRIVDTQHEEPTPPPDPPTSPSPQDMTSVLKSSAAAIGDRTSNSDERAFEFSPSQLASWSTSSAFASKNNQTNSSGYEGNRSTHPL